MRPVRPQTVSVTDGQSTSGEPVPGGAGAIFHHGPAVTHPRPVRPADPTLAVEFLAGLAGAGRVLELASGTGRVMLPLSARGVDVQGVEGSAAMVARMR
jgi:SAM-dependent methyltransferase